MTLVKTSLLNAIAVAIKMLTLLGINKILAIYVGPAGYAALGQFQNAVQIITTFASGAINTGVVKYTAEYHDDEARQRCVWQTAGSIALIGSLIAATLVAMFSHSLAVWFLQDPAYSDVFFWFAATLILFTFNALLLAILNGKKEIGRYVIANVIGSLFALLITGLMTIFMGLYGALVALAIYQSLTFFATLLLCYRANWFKIRYVLGRIDRGIAVNLARFTAMALTSAVCVPGSQILIRNHLGETLGWEAAGYWEAMWRLSGAYLMLVTTTLGVYYLPRLSELSCPKALRQEILQGYRIILPIAAVCGLVIYLLRDFIVKMLFTPEFSVMSALFGWQMVGDTLKIGSWILACLMLGKGLARLYIVTEVFFNLLFVLLTYLLTSNFGLVGVVMAYAANYLLYWVVVAVFARRYLNARSFV